jgi:poly(A) polymerase
MPKKVEVKVSDQPWIGDAATRAVMDALEGQARFVGGCVRNALLGLEVGDVDIATPLLPAEVIERIEAAGLRAVPTGIDHGTVTAVSGGRPFEITTLRRDVETDGRHATVEFSDDWIQDARRRDFTINTLLADRDGQVYDPLGLALADLQARRVVFVGDPDRRIAEDHLRILRFFRFHAFYGAGPPDVEALRACRKAAAKISTLSKERITQEFFKILSAPHPDEVLALMFANDVLNELRFPEYDPAFMSNLCAFQDRYGLAFIAARLLALAGIEERNIETLARVLLIPKVFVKDMTAVRGVLALPDLSDEQAVRVAVYKFGRVATAQALMIELANDRVMNGFAPAALNIIQKWDIPAFPVRGEDLIAQGIKPGPELGSRLAALEEEWIASGFGQPK